VTRNLALLLTSVLLVFALTACGGNRKTNGTNNTANEPANNAATDNNGTNNANNGVLDNNNAADRNTTNNGGLVGDAERAGEDLVGGVEGAVKDVLPGTNNTANGTANRKNTGTGSTTYNQMVRNGQVRDTDGYLRNYENAVTPGWGY